MNKKWACYQFFKELNHPVYIRFDESEFGVDLNKFLLEHQFSKIDESDIAKTETKVLRTHNARMLTLEVTSPLVAGRIDRTFYNKSGGEQWISKDGHKIYCNQQDAIIVYSHGSKFWTMGVYPDFFSKTGIEVSRVVLNRFLSWSMASLAVIGLWGVPVEEGVVIMRPQESQGECVFIDVNNFNILSLDGPKKIRGRFHILRLDPTLHGRNIVMTKEELMGFIVQNCVYYEGSDVLPVPIRQMIQTVANIAIGLVHPQESFKPRTDLSL